MNKLKYHRKKIDDIDKGIVKLLLLRFGIAKQIASYKKKNNIEVLDKNRELQIINNIKKRSDKKNQKFVVDIFENIIDYSKKIQSK